VSETPLLSAQLEHKSSAICTYV